jgi:hypothetical protein
MGISKFTTLLGAGLMLALLISTAFTDFFRMTLWFGIPFTLLLVATYFYSRRGKAVLSTPAQRDIERVS